MNWIIIIFISVIVGIVIVYFFLINHSKSVIHATDQKYTDYRDGNVYKIVKIGNQIWFAENLRYIPHVCRVKEDGGIWVYGYNGENNKKATLTKNYKTFGCLYNLETALEICPEGWHLPNDKEWIELIDFLGGKNIADKKLKSRTGWDSQNIRLTNECRFSALPGGYRNSNGSFHDIGRIAYWWSASVDNRMHGLDRDGYFNSVMLGDLGNIEDGFSIRCIRDN